MPQKWPRRVLQGPAAARLRERSCPRRLARPGVGGAWREPPSRPRGHVGEGKVKRRLLSIPLRFDEGGPFLKWACGAFPAPTKDAATQRSCLVCNETHAREASELGCSSPFLVYPSPLPGGEGSRGARRPQRRGPSSSREKCSVARAARTPRGRSRGRLRPRLLLSEGPGEGTVAVLWMFWAVWAEYEASSGPGAAGLRGPGRRRCRRLSCRARPPARPGARMVPARLGG